MPNEGTYRFGLETSFERDPALDHSLGKDLVYKFENSQGAFTSAKPV